MNFFWISFWLLASVVFANPFAILEQPLITQEDYIQFQKQLRSIDRKPIRSLMAMHPDPNFLFRAGRVFVGANMGIIDVEKGSFPIQKLEKMGEGGRYCLVCYCSYNRIYPELLLASIEALRKTGFNGYIYYRIGGFPNPNGWEMRYAGVPMSFKIAMMQEAAQLGFDTVLWMDAAILPLKDPTPVFDLIAREGYLLHGWQAETKHIVNDIAPVAREALIATTGVDPAFCTYLSCNLFGLQMNTEKAKLFIERHNECVKSGIPFLSCFPEEPVFASLAASLNPEWKVYSNFEREVGKLHCWIDSFPEDIEERWREDFFFCSRPH